MPVDQWKKANDRAKYGPAPYKGHRKSRKDRQIGRSRKRIADMDCALWFGKHKGKTVRHVLYFDKPYLQWLANQPEPPATKQQWRMKTLKDFLKKRLRLAKG
jgi:hypothetical protein